jgi:O-antigen ligase
LAVRLDWGRWGGALAGLPLAAAVGLLAGLQPVLAIAAALAVGFTLLCFADLAAGTALFALITFTEFLPGGGAIVSVTKAAGLVLALAWFALIVTRPSTRGEFFGTHPVVSVVLVAFVGWSLVSFVWAEEPSTSLSAALRLALNVGLMIIVFTAARTAGQARMIATAFVAGTAIAAAYGVLTPPTEEQFGRLSAGSLDPNQLAAALCAGSALAIGIAAAWPRQPLIRWGAVVVAVFAVIAIFLTASRGGLISLSVALLAAAIFGRGWRPQIGIFAAVLSVVAFIYFTGFASDQVRERLESTTQGQSQTLEGRTTIWAVGWRVFEDNPGVGVGAGNFGVSSRHYVLDAGALGRTDQIIDVGQPAHNSYLEVMSELGLIGLAGLLTILGFCLWCALSASRRFQDRGNDAMGALSFSLFVALAGTLAANFFITELYSNHLWLLLGLAPALRAISVDAEAEAEAAPE